MDSWSGKTVLVTGSEGFIGSHLCERLFDLGANVRAFVLYNFENSFGWLADLIGRPGTQDRVEVVFGDIRDLDSLLAAIDGVDTVFNLASLIAIPYSYIAPRSYVETNVMGTLNVLAACRAVQVRRLLQVSTSEVYGSAKYVPIDEKHPLQGQSPYSASKIGADMMALSFHSAYEMPVSIARPFNTYGPRQSERAIIPTILSQLLSDSNVLRLGATSPTRDFNFVKDTVEGIIAVAQSDATVGRVWNIGSGQEIAVGQLAMKLMNIIGVHRELVEESVRIRPKGSEVNRLLADASDLQELTGWRPKFDLDSGLAETVDWFRENRDRLRPELYIR